MRMSRYLMVRIVAVGLAILLAALVLALWRAQADVEREELGAAAMVHLFERLGALGGTSPDKAADIVDELRRMNAGDDLRHVRFELRDASGPVLVAARPDVPRTWLETAFARFAPGVRQRNAASPRPWVLQGADGRAYVADVRLSPASEQREALDDLLGLLGLLTGFAAAILLAVYWTLKRALRPLQPILAAIAGYERDDFSHRLPAMRLHEMDAIGRALNHLAEALAQAQAQRRTLSLKLLTSQEDERARVARELHDEFGQALTALRADAHWLAHRTAAQPAVHEVAQALSAHGERLQAGVRELLRGLRSRDVHGGDGTAALRRLLDELAAAWRERGLRVDLDFAADDVAIGDDLARTLYRLTQEALTNAMRHAQATRVGIAIRIDGGDVEWRCEDDGIGLDDVEHAAGRGYGLAGMRERVWAHGGELRIGPVRSQARRPGLRLLARFGVDATAGVPESRC